MWITVEDTTALDPREGYLLNPGDAIVIAAGMDVEAAAYLVDGLLFFMGLGEAV